MIWIVFVKTLSNSRSKKIFLCLSKNRVKLTSNIWNCLFGKFIFHYENLNFTSKIVVYDNNQVTINADKGTCIITRSKHIVVKCHWFRENIGKEFEIYHIIF